MNFNDEAFLDNPHGKDFTNDMKELEEALTRIDSRGGTAMRDAIRMSIDHLKEKSKKDKKVLVVVTDGNDNSSVISLENLVKASQQSEVLIYAVGLLSEEERREAKRAERALNDLARGDRRRDRSSRRTLPKWSASPTRWRATSAASTRSNTRRRTRRWTARSAPIKVAVKGPGSPTARTRSGYYATENQNPPAKGATSFK